MPLFLLSIFVLLNIICANPIFAAQTKDKNSTLTERTDKIAEYKLQNGLRLLMVKDNSAPVVTVMVLYHVGSRNEAVGHTGSTHLLEHMLFKGTPTFNKEKGTQLATILESIGADFNASTWYDRTNYYETLPSDKLEVALQLEADRMRNAFINDSDRSAEMTVVLNELELSENDPSAVLDQQVYATAFREHPYHHPTIGWRSDVENVPTAKLKNFYNTFYWPNNATLILVGDFDESNALTLTEKYFLPISASPEPIPSVYTVEPKQQGERRFVLRRAGELPLIEMGWHIVDGRNKAIYPLILLDAILSKGITSRLYQSLVDKQLVASVEMNIERLADPGFCQIAATLQSNVALAKVEKIILAEIERLKTEPIKTADLERAKALVLAEYAFNNDGCANIADQIAEALSNGDWHIYTNFAENIKQVTSEQIQQVVKDFFYEDNLTVGWFEPIKNSEKVAQFNALKSNDNQPFAGPAYWRIDKNSSSDPSSSTIKLPAPNNNTRQPFSQRIKKLSMDNGAVLLTLERNSSPTVAVVGSMLAGDYFDPSDKPYLAYMVAEMLNKGTKRWNKIELASQLERIGASLDFNTDAFKLTIDGRFIAKDTEQVLTLLAEILRHPTFPAAELAKLKQQVIAQLQQELEEPSERAYEKFSQTIFDPKHPLYERSIADRIKSVESITIKDIERFYQKNYGGASLILSLVGDVNSGSIEQIIKQQFNDWRGGNSKTPSIDPAQPQTGSKREMISMKDKASADIYIGHVSNLQRSNSDYYAAMLANNALGESTLSSRLGLQVRDTEGLTYGITSRFFYSGVTGGCWAINVSVNPENIDKAITSSLNVVRAYQQSGIGEKELANMKGAAIGIFKVKLSTNTGIAERLEEMEFYKLGLDYIDRFPQLIEAVSKADVDAAIRNYFHPDNVTIVVAGEVKNKE